MSFAGSLDPDRLATTEFSNSFRGYDTGEVRALLVAVSDAMRAASEREHELRERLAFAERELLDLREATAAAAEEVAGTGRQQGREMVAEAQRVRERMLGDLARRRHHARQQVEQLMAGRERLLEAFEVVRQTIDTATQEMRASLPEARLAAEAAGRRSGGEAGDGMDGDEDAVAALEEEIDAARLAGLPIIEEQGPEEAVSSTGSEPPVPGERDLGELPLVEPSADFEDVRIVPVATEPKPEDEPPDEPEAPTEVDQEPEHGEERNGPEPDLEPAPGIVAADPGSLDDLFAGLRAARAEAVVDARSVLAGAPSSDAPDDESAAPAAVDDLPGRTPSADGPAPEDRAAVVQAVHHRESLTSAREALGSALKRVLADEQNEVLDRLRRVRKNQVPSVPDVLGDSAAFADRLAATVLEPLGAVAAIGMTSMSPDRRARPPAEGPMAAALGVEIADPLHERLRRGLGDAGPDVREATERVRASFRECKTKRIEAVVADATSSAYHQGVLAGARKRATLRWALDDADEACPDCADNALAGSVVRGGAFPTGHHHPPAHAGCRCGLELVPGPSA